MDYQKYISVRHDYILLPEHALTNTTRLRWWQPFTISNGIVVSGPDRAQWALDNILIGGAEINPSQLVDTFDDGKKGCDSYSVGCCAFIWEKPFEVANALFLLFELCKFFHVVDNYCLCPDV